MKWLAMLLVLIASVSVGQTAFTDNFDTMSLNPRWQINTDPCPTQPNSTCTFQTGNVDMSGGNMRLQLTQTAGVTATSTGAQVQSTGLYGYGTYTVKFRAASPATNVAAGGASVSGSISSPFLYLNSPHPSETEIDFPEIEGNHPTTIEWTTWQTVSLKQASTTTFAGWDTAIHEAKMIWQPGQVQFFIDGVLKQTHTQNIPTAPAFFILTIYGTNASTFGGVATTGNRYMYVTQATFSPSGSAPAVHIDWTSTSTPSANYSLYRGTASGGPYSQLQTGIACCGVIDTTADQVYMLTGSYCYAVTAVAGGVESILSNESCVGAAPPVLPPLPPPVPPVINPNPLVTCYNVPLTQRRRQRPRLIYASYQSTPINITSSGVLTWMPTNFATSYNVKRSVTPGGPYTLIGIVTAAGCVDNRVAPKTTYYWVVSATNSIGTSPDSAEVTANIP